MKKEVSLIEGNIMSSLLWFTVPIFGALFVQALYGAVDLMIVGQFASTADVSGVATSSLVTATMTQVVTGLSMGITVLVGEKIGEAKPEEAGKAIGCGIMLFGVIAMVLTLVLMFGAEAFASLLEAPLEAMSQTIAYIRICGIGFLFIVAYNVIGAIFRGLGDAKTPLMTVAIACIFNIIGDLLFVAVFDLGARGAAIATVMAQGVSVIISLCMIVRRKLPFTFSVAFIRFDAKIIAKELKLGAPIALQEIFVGISFMYIQAIINALGVFASAGVGIADKISNFMMLIPSAYMQSMSAFIAQNMGAGQTQRAHQALKLSLQSAFAIGFLLFCLQFFCGDRLAALFTGDAQVILVAHNVLRAYGIDSLVCPMAFCFIGYFNGCEESYFVMLQGFIGAVLIRMPFAAIMSHLANASVFLIALSTAASSFVQLVLCVAYWFYLAKIKYKPI